MKNLLSIRWCILNLLLLTNSISRAENKSVARPHIKATGSNFAGKFIAQVEPNREQNVTQLTESNIDSPESAEDGIETNWVTEPGSTPLFETILPLSDDENAAQTFQPSLVMPNAEADIALKFQIPKPTALGKSILFWSTRYFTPSFVHSENKRLFLHNLEGEAIAGAKLTQKEWCTSSLEGSVRIKQPSGRYLNFNFEGFGTTPQVDCSPYFDFPKSSLVRFKKSKGPYGDGYHNSDYILFPYRTLATDPTFIPLGTVVYIPQARGAKIELSSGKRFVHDGYFIAADIGGAIKGSHIDVFQGNEYTESLSSFIKSNSKEKFKAYIVMDSKIVSLLNKVSKSQTTPLKGTEF